jgi:nitrate/TMAO reductase-like tetraheme cytochrome c subunit
MTVVTRRRQLHGVFGLVCLIPLLGTVVLARQGASDECLTCHGEPLEIAFADQGLRTLHVAAGELDGSVHAGMACVDCHPSASEVPHPERVFTSDRQFTVAQSEGCRQCHFSEYQATLESVHARAAARGDVTAPICTDCHGGHDVQPAGQPRTRVAEMCGRCHTGAAQTFATSVHGQDVARNIADVPTCTDCHGGHRIAGPDMPGWRSSTPEICGDCHGDPRRMAPYGLSANVLTTYLSDFHGKTASLRAAAGEPAHDQTIVAVCSDCHGTHGVTRVDSPSSPVLRANVLNTCQTCHPDAGVQFQDAWLSHYEPSWQQTPGLMTVQAGYAILIPLIIGGMVLQILLHLWRMATNR